MLQAFADGSRILDRTDFREIADPQRDIHYWITLQRRWSPLAQLERWPGEDRPGFLEDYAFFIEGLLALYRVDTGCAVAG